MPYRIKCFLEVDKASIYFGIILVDMFIYQGVSGVNMLSRVMFWYKSNLAFTQDIVLIKTFLGFTAKAYHAIICGQRLPYKSIQTFSSQVEESQKSEIGIK